VILSILNGFAAWYAGARKDTYAVCGDDLIGFWPRTVVENYVQTLERLALVVNREKSFYGRRGVFCERLVEIHGYEAVAKDQGHLSSCTAAKFLAHKTSHALAVADSLDLVLPEVSDLTRQKLVPRGSGPGRVRNYGCGKGALHVGGLITLAKRGNGLQVADPLPKGITEAIRGAEKLSGQIAVRDLIIAMRTTSHQMTLLSGKAPVPPRPLSPKEFRRLAKLNKPCGQKGVEKLQDLVRASKQSRSVKKAVLWTIKCTRRLSSNTKARRRIERLLERPDAERFLSREFCQKLLKERYALDIGDRVLRQTIASRRTESAEVALQGGILQVQTSGS
jgi:hypothetical protein